MTVSSGIYKEKIQSLAPDMEVSSLVCPKFVPLVESNELASSVTKKVVYETLKPLVGKVDTLVLGCTHYPLLKPIIQNVMGPDVKLIDSGAECVRDISVLLNYFELNKSRELLEQTHRFYTTANANSFAAIAEKWLERSVNVEHVNLWVTNYLNTKIPKIGILPNGEKMQTTTNLVKCLQEASTLLDQLELLFAKDPEGFPLNLSVMRYGSAFRFLTFWPKSWMKSREELLK